ncbi:hypothetical protein ACIPY5_15370 [Microbacterium sp. NPDC089698]|uniref:hypothetical protein n=1 Tax=Microbacterium sp. NPDC089698 TaxID=3364200 RepID=UPI0037FFD14D
MLDITGRWDIEWASAFGTEHITLNLIADGDVITGTARDDVGEYALTNGVVAGDQVSGEFRMVKPIPLTVTFTAKVRGDTLAGKAKAGVLPAAPITGYRANS